LNNDEQSEIPPRTINAWDFFALLSDSVSDIFAVITNFFTVLTHMLDTQASFVDDKKSFHEYAARTIETLKEGE
jgi:hypothetical protein